MPQSQTSWHYFSLLPVPLLPRIFYVVAVYPIASLLCICPKNTICLFLIVDHEVHLSLVFLRRQGLIGYSWSLQHSSQNTHLNCLQALPLFFFKFPDSLPYNGWVRYNRLENNREIAWKLGQLSIKRCHWQTVRLLKGHTGEEAGRWGSLSSCWAKTRRWITIHTSFQERVLTHSH